MQKAERNLKVSASSSVWQELPQSGRAKEYTFSLGFIDVGSVVNRPLPPCRPAIDYIIVLLDPTVSELNLTNVHIGELLGTEDHVVIDFVLYGELNADVLGPLHKRVDAPSFTVWDLIVRVASVYYLLFDTEDVACVSESVADIAQMIENFSELEDIYCFVKLVNAALGRLQDRRCKVLEQEGLNFEELFFSCLKVFQRIYLHSICSSVRKSSIEGLDFDPILNGQFSAHLKIYHQNLKRFHLGQHNTTEERDLRQDDSQSSSPVIPSQFACDASDFLLSPPGGGMVDGSS